MDFIFIKEGYSLWAAVLGPLWLLAKAMWIEAGVYIALIMGGSALLSWVGFNAAAISTATLFANLVLGLFARDVERFHIERKGYKLIEVVNGKSLDECESRFFRQENKAN